MKSFALPQMMYQYWLLGSYGSILLYALLLAVGVGMRLLLSRRRDFVSLLLVSGTGWLICEIITDIGAARDGVVSVTAFAYAVELGACCLCFFVGFLLCALVCRAAKRRPLR